MRRRRPTLFAALLLYAFPTFLMPAPARAATVTAAAVGDASVAHDETAGTWTLSAGATNLTLAVDANRDLAVTRLVTGSGVSWIRSAISDSIIKVGNQTVALGARSAGFALRGVSIDTMDQRLQLNATFELASASLRVTRHWAVVSGSPTFEAWNTYTTIGGSTPAVSDLNALQIVVTPGVVHTVTGLRGDTAAVDSGIVFNRQQQTIGSTTPLAIGASGRSSESWVPWMSVDGAHDEFYVALMWSGAWSMTAIRSGSGLSIAAGLGQMTTKVVQSVDGPHALFGAASGSVAQASAALASYLVNGVRAGRPLTPLVTYNTWFAYGTDIDEASMMAEMDAAAGLGAELFVVDAGWYLGAGAAGPGDYDSGLGSWTPDPARFPNGLRPVRDHAQGLGMKFGLWVEPERVSQALIGSIGLDEEWLAQNDGQYGSDNSALLCLANSAARDWILGWLTPLLDQVQPDYLKWDNNLWVTCNREGHEHGVTDGNFAQVSGLYQVLQAVRDQYPDLLIENVSGGGNRLDAGMLRYTDVAWMDDRTAPSVHVRHNLEGLSAVFPPGYLLSFVTDNDTEPIHDAPDMSLYMRSRMPGVLGLCFKSADFTEGEAATVSHEIAIYKAIRDTLGAGTAALLTAQAQDDNGPPWDVLQATAAAGGQAVICAYQSDDSVDTINVKPINLDAGTTYAVQSVDTGPLGEATGADLMANGIDIVQSPNTAAHILIINPQD